MFGINTNNADKRIRQAIYQNPKSSKLDGLLNKICEDIEGSTFDVLYRRFTNNPNIANAIVSGDAVKYLILGTPKNAKVDKKDKGAVYYLKRSASTNKDSNFTKLIWKGIAEVYQNSGTVEASVVDSNVKKYINATIKEEEDGVKRKKHEDVFDKIEDREIDRLKVIVCLLIRYMFSAEIRRSNIIASPKNKVFPTSPEEEGAGSSSIKLLTPPGLSNSDFQLYESLCAGKKIGQAVQDKFNVVVPFLQKYEAPIGTSKFQYGNLGYNPQELQGFSRIFAGMVRYNNWDNWELRESSFPIDIQNRANPQNYDEFKQLVQNSLAAINRALVSVQPQHQPRVVTPPEPVPPPTPPRTGTRTMATLKNRVAVGAKYNPQHTATSAAKGKSKLSIVPGIRKSVTTPNQEPGTVNEGQVNFDSGQRFFMTTPSGKATRKGGGATQNAIIADRNNQILLDYYRKHSDPRSNFECDVVFEDLDDSVAAPRAGQGRVYIYIEKKDIRGGVVAVAKSLKKWLRENPNERVSDPQSDPKVLVIDAASEVTPGGAPASADKACEESECVETSLYMSLTAGDMDEFYIGDGKYDSDLGKKAFDYNPYKKAIAKRVMAMKGKGQPITEADIPSLEEIDVLVHASRNLNSTCCAQMPCKGLHSVTDDQIRSEIQASANQIIKMAVSGGYDAIVLNNLGGGVFYNSIYVWANALAEAIRRFGANIHVAFSIFDGKVSDGPNYGRARPQEPVNIANRLISEVYADAMRAKGLIR